MSRQRSGTVSCCRISFVGWLTGCAGFFAKPVPDSVIDGKVRGIRNYEPAPFILLYFTIFLLGLNACAWVTHRPISEAEDVNADGIRYYQASPYLFVHSDGRGGIVSEIIYLPDQTKKMVAKPFNLFAKVESTLEFNNGILKSSKDTLTADAVPKAIIEAVQKVAPLLAMARAEIPEEEVPAPYLYKIVVTADAVQFYGGPGDVPIKVAVHEEAK